MSPINHTLTNFADHLEDMSQIGINRFLRNEKMTRRLVWDNVREQIAAHEEGCIAFDDTIIDKDFSHRIVPRQYSGNAHGLIKGIGMRGGATYCGEHAYPVLKSLARRVVLTTVCTVAGKALVMPTSRSARPE